MLERYYDGYRFSPRATERVFNSDMVLYFLSEASRNAGYPESMLDPNVRTDYSRLQRLTAMVGAGAEERREVLFRPWPAEAPVGAAAGGSRRRARKPR